MRDNHENMELTIRKMPPEMKKGQAQADLRFQEKCKPIQPYQCFKKIFEMDFLGMISQNFLSFCP